MMKRRPQSALIIKSQKDTQLKSDISSSQLVYNQKPANNQAAPQQFFLDQEGMYFQNLELKQKINELKYENMRLKSNVNQSQKIIKRIEKVDKYQLNSDPLGVQQQGEGSIVPILKNKIKDQAIEIEQLQADLQKQYKSVKLTQVLELQKEVKQYQDEVLKLRQLVSCALKISDQDLFNDPDISQRISNFALIINAQENQIEVTIHQNNQLTKELQDLINENEKLRDDQKQLNFEKAQLKKQLEEALMTSNVEYKAQKQEFVEKKLHDTLKQIDQLKGELSVIEIKYKQATKQLRDTDKIVKQEQLQSSRRQQQLEDQLIKKDLMNQDLQERVQLLDLLKQKSSPKMQEQSPLAPVRSPLIPPVTFREQGTQYPEMSYLPQEIQNTKPISQERLKQLQQILKLKIIRLKLTKDRLQYIFKNKPYIQLKAAIGIFKGAPFQFNDEDAVTISRYFISEDHGEGYSLQYEDTQEVAEIIRQLHTNGAFTWDYITFKSISCEPQLIRKLQGIYNKPSIQQLNAAYPIHEYQKVLQQQCHVSSDLLEYLTLINCEYTGDFRIIDHKYLLLHFHQEFEILSGFQQLNNSNFKIYQSTQASKNSPDVESFNFINSTNQHNKVQSIIMMDPVISMAQIRQDDYGLKNSESRKPKLEDSMQYSQSNIGQSTISRQVYQPHKLTVGSSINFNVDSQYQESPIKSGKDSQTPIKAFSNHNSTDSVLFEPPNLQNRQHFDTIVSDEQQYDEEIMDDYVEDL